MREEVPIGPYLDAALGRDGEGEAGGDVAQKRPAARGFLVEVLHEREKRGDVPLVSRIEARLGRGRGVEVDDEVGLGHEHRERRTLGLRVTVADVRPVDRALSALLIAGERPDADARRGVDGRPLLGDLGAPGAVRARRRRRRERERERDKHGERRGEREAHAGARPRPCEGAARDHDPVIGCGLHLARLRYASSKPYSAQMARASSFSMQKARKSAAASAFSEPAATAPG